MSIYDDFDIELEKNSLEMWGKYSDTEQLKINEWNKKIGNCDASNLTLFRDAGFVNKFLEIVSDPEEQYKFFENTYKYSMSDKSYNSDYVFFTRRSVLGETPKPESFWTSEHREVLCGLTNEIPKGSGQREYSVIMVTTLKKLINHGLSYTEGGASDGEIVIDPNKPFSDFFCYKPEQEMVELKEYQENGGKTYEQVLNELSETAELRKERQGFSK